MEYNLKNTELGTLQTCLDTVSEQPVDIDFTLPDYCPDIEKILRCKITPKIFNKKISGGQIQVDGTTVVTILYVDSEKNTLRACEQAVPFSNAFQAKGLCENNVIEISTKSEYINCRALSRRRLAVHGAFSLYLKAVSLENISLFSPDNDENIECDTSEIEVTGLSSLSQACFNVCDEISVSNRPPIELILTSDVKANVTDYKIVSEKLMLNGELCVKLLYLSDFEKSQPQQLDYVIPFSQIIDCENLKESSLACVSLDVMCSDIRLKNDMLSESPSVSVDAKISAAVYGYDKTNATIINDAYCTQYQVELNKAHHSLLKDVNSLKDTFMQKEVLSLGDNSVSEICDISVDRCSVTPMISADGLNLNFNVNISILAFDGEKVPVYLERSIDFAKEIQWNSPISNVIKSMASVVSLSYRIGDDNTLELRCEMKYMIVVSNHNNFTIVSQIVSNEENPVIKSPCALTLYYANTGERLWDIAKEYKTKLSMLYEENNLDCETLESPRMLMIPTV